LNIINRPIVDLHLPNNAAMVANILDVTRLLHEGTNVLVHCAGGNGRTGLVIAGVLRQCGIPDPIVWARQVKSTYVETPEQEAFVFALPMAFDVNMAKKNPQFAEAVVCETLVLHVMAGTDVAKLPKLEMKAEQQVVYKVTFELFDKAKSGVIDIHEVRHELKRLGVQDDALGAMQGKKTYKIDLETFYRLMMVPPQVPRTELFASRTQA